MAVEGLTLSREQIADLQRRVVDADANPNDALAWEEIKADALLRLSANPK